MKTGITILIVLLLSATGWAKYSGGNGEPNDPYLIATPNDLNSIGLDPNDWDKHFLMINDVNLSDFTGTEFNIIGIFVDFDDPNNKPFTGVFDGNCHTIHNFTYTSTEINAIGLFVNVLSETEEKGVIKKLGLKNVNINSGSGQEVGPLVGINEGIISDCYATGNVAGKALIGGIVGYNRSNTGTISRSYSTAHVSGESIIGGLVGENGTACTIERCYATGNVIGTDFWIGGLVGWNAYGSVLSCYATGDVSGNTDVGGLTGFNLGGIISDSYATGSVTGNSSLGGLCGIGQAPSNSYFLDPCDGGGPDNGLGTPLTDTQMRQQANFSNWDFLYIWDIGENQTYPFLRTHLPSDINKDDETNLYDLSILALNWLMED